MPGRYSIEGYRPFFVPLSGHHGHEEAIPRIPHPTALLPHPKPGESLTTAIAPSVGETEQGHKGGGGGVEQGWIKGVAGERLRGGG